jgi:hypothetical protein
MTGNDGNEWQKLTWSEKIQISQQRIAQEDSLLIAYAVIFIGLEAIFFAAIFTGSNIMPHWLKCTIPAFGIFLAIVFAIVCKRRGDMVDRWSFVFSSLWKIVPHSYVIAAGSTNKEKKLDIKAEDIGKDYEGSIERLRGGLWGWVPNIAGWPTLSDRLKNLFQSGRRFTVIITPILVIITWAFILYLVNDS